MNRLSVSKFISKLRSEFAKTNTEVDMNNILSTRFTKPTENFIDWTEEEKTLENDTYLLDRDTEVSAHDKKNLKGQIKLAKMAIEYKERISSVAKKDKKKEINLDSKNRIQDNKTSQSTNKQDPMNVFKMGAILFLKDELGYYCKSPRDDHLKFLENKNNKWYLIQQFEILVEQV